MKGVVIQVTNFLRSLPEVWVEVEFIDNTARIIERSGYTHEEAWDRQAIEAARKLLPKN